MSRLVKKNRSSIRRYLSDPVNYGQKNKEYSGRKKASFRDKRNVIRTASNSSKSLNEIKAELGLDVCLFFSLSSVTDVAHIHSNKTMLPLTPTTQQRTCSRLKESKCSIGRLAARASIRLRNYFKTAVQGEWDAVSIGEPKKLVATMPNRVVEEI
uniref:Transposable element Tc3 transposase-like DNA-binding HTH domain-containing protein n=1 Tax=Caenorhabditis japonica TaxID=281687 RepID=A0A8R1E106_CAEJA